MDESKAQRRPWKAIRVGALALILVLALAQYGRVKLEENWSADWNQVQEVTLVLLIPPKLTAEEKSALDNTNSLLLLGDENATFARLEEWFQQEHQRFGSNLQKSPIRFEVKGPFALTAPTPLPPADSKSLIDRFRQSREFLGFYDSVQEKHHITGKNIVFVVFYPKANESFFKTVHSVADRRSHRGFVFAPIDTKSAHLVLINVAHETLHLFGATDKYQGQRCVFPIGYYDPLQSPRYPQEFAEVMAQGTPQSPEKEEIVQFFEDMRLGVETAWEIGWIEQKRRDLYYKGDRSQGPHSD